MNENLKEGSNFRILTILEDHVIIYFRTQKFEGTKEWRNLLTFNVLNKHKIQVSFNCVRVQGGHR